MKARVLERVSIFLVLWLVLVGSGCQSQQRSASLQTGLNESIDSVQAGDLKTARTALEGVKGKAKSFEEKRLVQSVDELIAGAESLMQGEVGQAKVAWSNIEDPQLNREVRVKASAVMGLDVPMIAVKNTGKETEKEGK